MAGVKRTRLQRWLNENGFTSVQLEEASGIARQSMTKIRGGADARKRTMLRILAAARKLKGPEVQMLDLFDLDPDSPENQT
jgi:predicted transcriptional regulator